MRRVLLVVLVLLTCAAGVHTARLYTASPLDRSTAQVTADALPRLGFLRGALEHDRAGEDMQGLFPEGYFFTYELYGLSWVNLGLRTPGLRDRALAEARWALAHLDSAPGRAAFSPALVPAYGVFYVGWSSWLRGGVVKLAGAGAPEADRLAADTDALAAAFDASASPYLCAYPGQAWPVDSAVAVAALRLAGTHPDTVERWLAATDRLRDPATGLLPHRADPVAGTPIGGARATSQVVALRFLREVDPGRADRNWAVFRRTFASTVPGIPGVREYPRGTDSEGDVDSGPLVGGLSASASAVALGDAVLFGDAATASALTGLAEGTGLALNGRYLGGLLPIGDAFLAWSVTSVSWVAAPARVSGSSSGWWRLPWHAVTVGLLAPWWYLLWRSFRRRRALTARNQP